MPQEKPRARVSEDGLAEHVDQSTLDIEKSEEQHVDGSKAVNLEDKDYVSAKTWVVITVRSRNRGSLQS